jgi:hypothetical protein
VRPKRRDRSAGNVLRGSFRFALHFQLLLDFRMRSLDQFPHEICEHVAIAHNFRGRDGWAIRQSCVLRNEDRTMLCVYNRIDIEGLCESLHDCPAKWSAMISLYIDESGTHKKSHVIVAGFLGKKRHWSKFDPVWNAGLGNRPFLHINGMPFKYETERVWLEALAPIPYECGLKAGYGGVNVADYEDLVKGTVAEVYAHSVSLALVPLILDLVAKIPGDERFEFNFEDSPLNFYIGKMMGMIAGYRGLRRHDGKSRIAGWAFRPKHESSLFQPADYIANHLYNKQMNPESRRALWTAPICRDRELIGGLFRRDSIRSVFAHITSEEHTKNIPNELIKAYKKEIRQGTKPDPWRNLCSR